MALVVYISQKSYKLISFQKFLTFVFALLFECLWISEEEHEYLSLADYVMHKLVSEKP